MIAGVIRTGGILARCLEPIADNDSTEKGDFDIEVANVQKLGPQGTVAHQSKCIEVIGAWEPQETVTYYHLQKSKGTIADDNPTERNDPGISSHISVNRGSVYGIEGTAHYIDATKQQGVDGIVIPQRSQEFEGTVMGTRNEASGSVPEFGSAMLGGIVHQKQRLMHCAVHSANNMLQSLHFTSVDFEVLAQHLEAQLGTSSICSPHRSMFGIGNYDANVLILALEGYDPAISVSYFDSRRDPQRDVELFCEDASKGNGLHWYAITLCGTKAPNWYNLDSVLDQPRLFKGLEDGEAAVRWHLSGVLQKGTILVVRKKTRRQSIVAV